MDGYLETVGVLAIALLGLLAGKIISSLKGHYWVFGYFVSLILTVLLIMPRLYYPLHFLPPSPRMRRLIPPTATACEKQRGWHAGMDIASPYCPVIGRTRLDSGRKLRFSF